MKTTPAFLIIAALGLSACANPDRFDNAGTDPLSNQAYNATPAPLSPAQDPTSPVYFQQTIGDRVLFAVDTSSLTPAGIATLEGQARWLMDNGDYLAVIEGHADEQGTREYNLALGARRANTVRDFLVSKGIASTRIRTISYGKERPIEVCSTEACYAKNRRAVTIISSGAVS
ncbi:MAG: peptidoglycan-associated lipoprotein [Rhodobacterales bacterium]|nr:MAG: peptidoglycan-associated lipoprotein [Rhodobacterales bacterium]